VPAEWLRETKERRPPSVFPRCWEQCYCCACCTASPVNVAASGGAAGPPPRQQPPSLPPTPPPRAPVEDPSSAVPAARSQVVEQPGCVQLNICGQSRPQDVYVEIDDDSSINDNVRSQNAESSVIGVYLKHVYAQLHLETIGTASQSGSSEPWHLKSTGAMFHKEGIKLVAASLVRSNSLRKSWA